MSLLDTLVLVRAVVGDELLVAAAKRLARPVADELHGRATRFVKSELGQAIKRQPLARPEEMLVGAVRDLIRDELRVGAVRDQLRDKLR